MTRYQTRRVGRPLLQGQGAPLEPHDRDAQWPRHLPDHGGAFARPSWCRPISVACPAQSTTAGRLMTAHGSVLPPGVDYPWWRTTLTTTGLLHVQQYILIVNASIITDSGGVCTINDCTDPNPGCPFAVPPDPVRKLISSCCRNLAARMCANAAIVQCAASAVGQLLLMWHLHGPRHALDYLNA
jgi:hypothetical protein